LGNGGDDDAEDVSIVDVPADSLVVPALSRSVSAKLSSDIEQITGKHRDELTRFLNTWLHQQQSSLTQAEERVGAAFAETTPLRQVSLEARSSPGLEVQGYLGSKCAPGLEVCLSTQPYAQRPEVPMPSEAAISSELRTSALAEKEKLDDPAVLKKTKSAHTDKPVRKASAASKRDALFADVRESHRDNLTRLQRLTDSTAYEWFSGTLIVSNALFIGWQCQYMAARAEDDARAHVVQRKTEPMFFIVCGVIYTILFAVELGARWVADGFIHFFQTREIWWNLLDVVVVLFGTLDSFMEAVLPEAGSTMGNITILRVLRVVRIVRIAKVIRVMPFFRELRMMVFSILGSLKSLLWVLLVLIILFYIFGIAFTAGALAHMDESEKWAEDGTAPLRLFFGTLDRSMISLFQAMAGGNDWGVFYDALAPLSMQYRTIFLLFISFAVFAVVNIVTGVFVESAMQAHHLDREVIVHEELEAKKQYTDALSQVFAEMDIDGSGCLSLDEFERRLDDERVIAYFNYLKLDISDARTVFRLLDFDHSEEVSITEFVSGCYNLQGESRALDMKIMQCEVKYLTESFETLHKIILVIRDDLNSHRARVASA